MKKIGILTIFDTHSYGGCLQALSTYLFFEEQGYDVQIVNYRNKTEYSTHKLMYKENNHFIGYITSFIKSFLFGKKRNYMVVSNSVKKYLRLSPKCEKAEDIDNLSFFALVSGSDQIWNYKITGYVDEAYLLKYGKASKRISVASSMGSTPIREEDRELFIDALKKYDAISVREEFAKSEIEKLGDFVVNVISDPVFLLSREQWLRKLSIKNNSNTQYILIYFVSPSKRDYDDEISAYSKKLECPVWSIQSSKYKISFVDRCITTLTIEEFVSLIQNAKLIITDSFHGTAFSIIFRKDFVVFENKENPLRVRELVEKIGISSRIGMKSTGWEPLIYDNEMEHQIETLRQSSIKWITSSLS